ELDLFANLRPATSIPGVNSRYQGVDLIAPTYIDMMRWNVTKIVEALK
ncbi:MAG: NAD-dependent isocitrate dehydrogenase, partial [Thermoleophilia bacterium]|nr:NAD-dependent isocitrate dehydrogenase [Thermoleophilia bacterium]